MDNKLSELSKPVGFVSKQAQALLKSGDTASVRPFFDVQGSSPLYSQEYVSALKHESAVNWEAAASLNVENQELKKRIAELEAIGAAAEKLVRCKGRYHSEQNYRALAALFGVTTPDLPPVDGDSEAVIAELRAKLATPVRLPNKNDAEFWFGSTFQVAKFDRAVERAVITAGFKFVGDE